MQRVVAGAVLIWNAGEAWRGGAMSAQLPPYFLAACGGVLLIAGLWTPLAGLLVGVAELWIMIAHSGSEWVALLLASMGATLAMVGPGARSVDAVLFGRKRIDPRLFSRSQSP